MVLGTASNVGKSLLTAALCRIFARHGLRVMPFKAQNMSLNSAATPEGLEIGRAQAFQAEAAGVAASVHMNPVLLKPSSDTASQIIVRGKVFAQSSAVDYFGGRNQQLWPVIIESYRLLADQSDLMILEGAGSPAEINLREHDIVNLRMARYANARCVLVGDIDRGGVFASIFGTLALLDEEERSMIIGFVINKFRGDVSLLSPGILMLEERTGKPCLGVIPYIDRLDLDEEDNVAMEDRLAGTWSTDSGKNRPLRIAILKFPSISNFTDFDPLIAEPQVEVHFCSTPQQAQAADLLILPGSKQTVSDLFWLRRQGFESIILEHAKRNPVLGICGGMQMLGCQIEDHFAMETRGIHTALNLLPIQTEMKEEKTTQLATGKLTSWCQLTESKEEIIVKGFEIHLGVTRYLDNARPFALLQRMQGDNQPVQDGCVSEDGLILGTYLHGLFQEDQFRHFYLDSIRRCCGLHPVSQRCNWQQHREDEFSRLTKLVEESVDLKSLAEHVGVTWEQKSK